MKKVLYICLFVTVVASIIGLICCRDYKPVDLGGGYYYRSIGKEIEYIPSGTRSSQIVLKDISAYKTLGEYIIIRKKLHGGSEVPHANIYYFIIDKQTHQLAGPYLYDEFLNTCTRLDINIF